MLRIIENFREKLVSGKTVYGYFSKSSDPAFIEAAGYGGFDFVILDLEHGPNSIKSVEHNVRAAQVAGYLPLVRVPFESMQDFSRALDVGAGGLMIPQISSAEQAREVLKVTKFYPEGERGVCRFVRAAGYSSMERSAYFAGANRALTVAQLEGEEAIRNLDEILEIKGLDIMFIGPYDLSQSLGCPGQVDHPVVVEAMKAICEKCRRKGIRVGTFTDTPQAVKIWKEAGVQFIAHSVDVGIFYEACRHLVEDIQKS